MGCSETEMAEQTLPMNPDAAKNRKSNGSTKQARGKQQQQQQQQQQQPRNKPAEVFQKLSHSPYGLSNNEKKMLAFIVIIVSLVLNVILIILISSSSSCPASLGRSGEVLPTAQPSPSTPTECCPDGWIGYQRKCYYFSESEGNWTYSQNYCASFNASLVMIDSQEEMRFLRRYKGPADHWIGLQRIDEQEPWRWINGTIFNNWFKIRGGGNCAYLNHLGVASSSRGSEEPWICSKPVGK